MTTRLERIGLWIALMRRRLSDPPATMAATSIDLCQNPLLAALAGEKPTLATRLLPTQAGTVVGWGQPVASCGATR